MNRATLLILAVAAFGCDRSNDTFTSSSDQPGGPKAVNNAPADNTEVNERDRQAAAVTPMDQGMSETDMNVTQRIRQEVVAADSLSLTAKNVKIVTLDGIVTLRGPVNTAEERSIIAAIAQRADGVRRVDNQLEVTLAANQAN